jgi:pyrroline-5-carboxylate reductase
MDSSGNLCREYGFKEAYSIKDLAQNVDVILLAIKPFIVGEVLSELKEYYKNHLILSILAGVKIEKYAEFIENARVIRIMPNTPALVNEGMSAVCKGHYANSEHASLAVEIFSKVGKVIESEEKYIDIITAISGSGPAFYYYIIDEIAKAGEKLGLDYETCLKLSAQTAFGAAKMVMESGVNPEQLIINVTTPGGCTAVGNEVLKENKISDILFDTIDKTAKKAFELGKK